ncbi:hypothetical protein Nmel_014868 [Mimus melanotis]
MKSRWRPRQQEEMQEMREVDMEEEMEDIEEDEEEPMILDEDRPQQQGRQVLAMPCPQAQWVPCGQAGAGLGGPAQGHGAPGRALDSGGTSTTPSLPCSGFGPCKSCPSAWGPAPNPSWTQCWWQSPALPACASLGAQGTALRIGLEWPHAASFSSRTDGDAGCGNLSFVECPQEQGCPQQGGGSDSSGPCNNATKDGRKLSATLPAGATGTPGIRPQRRRVHFHSLKAMTA